MYCTRADAIAAGAADLGAGLDAVIAEAQERVDGFTGTRFEPWTGTVRRYVDRDSRHVLLPSDPVVTGVTLRDPDVVVPVTGWRVAGSLLHLAVTGASDILVVGAEPWNGGYANLLGSLDDRPVDVAGTFGPPTVPGVVRRGTARLTAMLAPAPFTGQADTEGNPVGLPPETATTTATGGPTTEQIKPWGTDRGNAGRTEETTGLADVDRMLTPWRARHRARMKVG